MLLLLLLLLLTGRGFKKLPILAVYVL